MPFNETDAAILRGTAECVYGDDSQPDMFSKITSNIGAVSSALAPTISSTIGAIGQARAARIAAQSGGSSGPVISTGGTSHGLPPYVIPVAIGGAALVVLLMVMKKGKKA